MAAMMMASLVRLSDTFFASGFLRMTWSYASLGRAKRQCERGGEVC